MTVGGVDDDDVADESTRIAHAVTSADADYATLDVAAVAVTVADDDVAAVIVEPALLRVAEGGTVVYTVVLASRPTAPVIVTPASGDTGAATVSGALTFGPDDWDEAQKVTVGGVDDDDVADESTRIAHAVTSADADYATLDVAAVAVTVADDDVAAVIVEPALLRVAEGGTVVYTVVLASRPTAPVIVTPASGDTGAATVSGALTFGPDDWDEAQKVTVGGVDDDDVADESTRIAHAVTSADADYATLDVAAVAVTVADDDVAAVIVEPALLRVAEGGTVVYTVVLASRPTAPVIVTPASGDTGAATVSGALTFGPDDWDEAQKVTVGGVDDDDVADESTRIAHAVTSADADYATLDVAAVAVTVADDDVAAVIVEPALLRVAEGGTVVYTVVLASRPTAPVIVTPASGDTGAATVSGALTFGPDDWDEAQKVTVGGVDDDDVADGEQSTRIAHAVTSADADYATLDVAAVAVTVADDDVAAVIVEPALLRVAEGGTVVYTVVLASRPTAPVIVTPASGDTGAATVSGALTFGPDDWDEAQKVTVGGVDDDDVADESTRIAHAVTSADADYATLDVAAVAVTVADDDVAAVIVEPALLRVAEGGTVVYTVVLASRPTAPVIVTPASGDTGAATVSGALTFGPDDWDEAQKVTVGGVDDDDVADESTRIAHAVTSADADYATLDVAAVAVTVADDDVAAVIVEPALLRVAEGGTVVYTVVLASRPTAPVIVTPASGDTGAATVSGALTFGPDDWDEAQKVTVGGVDDDDVADESTRIAHAVTSADADYATLDVAAVAVTVADDDVAAVIVEPALLRVAEGGTVVYTVVLASRPTAPVIVTPASGDTGAATVSGALTFGPDDWDEAQKVTVGGVDDEVADGEQSTRIAHAVTSADADYHDATVSAVAVTVTDDDTAAVIVKPTSVRVAEGGTVVYRVRLTSRPTAPVTVTATSDSIAAATVSPGSVTFTTTDWGTAKTFTVTGVDDDDDADADRSTRIAHAVTSGDAAYSAVSVAPVAVNVTDDDTATATVTSTDTAAVVAPALLRVAEGGTVVYTVVLASRPTAPVIVTPASGDTGAATVSGALTFRPDDWNEAQKVTVGGVDDEVADGEQSTRIAHAVTSADADYHDATVSAVAVTVTDDDTAAVIVKPTSVRVAEGGTVVYRVVLASRPTAPVIVTPASDSIAAATVSPGSVTFTTTDWGTAKTFTVTGVDDDTDADADRSTRIAHAVTSGDAAYSAVSVAPVAVTVVDDDTAGVVVGSVSVSVAEGGGTAAYTVVLASRPSAPVTVTATSDSIAAATVSPGSVTFTTTDWGTAKTFTVTGVDDDTDADADRSTRIAHAVTSGDAAYSAVSVAPVAVTVVDDDVAAVIVEPTSVRVAEGGTVVYTVRLTSRPTAPVIVTPASGDDDAATVSGALTFRPDDWNEAQKVTVGGVDDEVADGEQSTRIAHAVTSADADYHDATVSAVAVTVTDDDTATATVTSTDTDPGALNVAAVSVSVVVDETSVSVAEGGGTAAYTVVLASRPSAPVTVTATSDSIAAATVSPGSVTFTTTDWGTAKTFTVTGVDDDTDADADRSTRIAHAVTSGDAAYSAVSVAPVAVTVVDDDTAGVVVGSVSVSVAEGGGTAAYTVVLASRPSAPVTVTATSDSIAAATVSPGSVTFTTTDWGTAKTFTVTGVDDDTDADADRSTRIAHAVTSGDAAYSAVSVAPVAVTVVDDDTAGVVVGSVSVSVAEGGGTAAYTVVLASRPSAPVTVTATSDSIAAATVSPGSVTFTTTDWGTAKTFTVTGVDDDTDADADRSTRIAHAVTSGDAAYSAVSVAPVAVTVVDDDTAGVVVGSVSVSVAEGGGTAAYTVVLASRPSAPVTVTATSDSIAAATVSPGSVTFTTTDWGTAKTFTVTGVDDDTDADADRSTRIAHAVTSGDAAYSAVSVAPVAVTVVDDDTAGVVVGSVSVSVAEGGGTAAYTVVLASRPSAPVTVTATSDSIAAATVSPGSVTFTTTDWGTAKTFTVTGVDDDTDADADRSTRIAHAVTSGDAAYSAVSVAPVAVTVVDDDTAGVVVGSVSVSVAEGGGTAAYTVVLASRPSAPVTVTATSDSIAAATVSPGSVTFTTTDWGTAKTFTVTGVDDDTDADADRSTRIAHAVTSGDAAYSAVSVAPVAVTVVDDDTAGVVVGSVSVSVAEGGGTAAYTVVLASRPSAPVTVTATSDSIAAATVSPGSVTFTTTDWGTAKTFTVTGVDDDTDADADRSTRIAHAVTSGDAAYSAVSVAPVAVTVVDDDTAGVVVGSVSVSVAEGGGTAAYTVVLASRPSAPVTVTATSDSIAAATVSPGSVTFTTTDWGTAKTFTVTGVDDDTDADADRSTRIAHAVTSGDAAYSAVSVAPVAVTVVDDDTAGVVVGSVSVSVAEGGGTAAYTVVLASRPSAPVTVTATSDSIAAATVSPGSVTFTTTDWGTAKTFTVTGVDDDTDADADRSTRIAHAVTSGDAAYSAVSVAPVAVTVVDDDTAGVVVGSVSVSVAEGGGTAAYTVVLASRPSAPVTVTATSDSIAAATVSPGSVTFTTTDWGTAKTFTVTGVDDDTDADADRSTRIAHAVTSGDAAYSAVSVAPVAVTVVDDDTAGVVVGSVSVSVAEGGGTAAYTVVLASRPSAPVTVTATSDSIAAATVSPGSVTFTTTDWGTAKTFTVTGVDDDTDADADRSTRIAHAVTSGDAAYSAVSVAPVAVTVVDDDTAGVVVGSVSVSVAEGGGTAAYTVVLASRPSAPVTVTATSDSIAAATVSPGSVTFTTTDWGTAKTFTVTGVDDDTDADADRSTRIAHAVTSGDAAYSAVSVAPVAVTVVDDDTAGVVVGSVSVSVAEGGGTAAYTVVLASRPSAPVTVTATSDSIAAATVSPGSVTFTTTDWGTAKTFTVTGVDDDTDADADRSTRIAHAVTSGDAAYSAVSVAPVAVTVVDDDTAGVVVGSVSVSVAEGGGTAAYTVVLASRPSAPVTVTATSDSIAAATVSPGSVTFTTTDWGTAKTFTVTGVDTDTDTDADADRSTRIAHAVTSGDAAYSAVSVAPVAVTVVGPNAEPTVVPRLREWTGGVGSLVLAAGARIVVAAGDGGRHWSNDFFSAVLGLEDPASAWRKLAARMALVDSPDATGWHTSSRRSLAQVAAKIAADIGSQTGLTLSVVTAGGGVAPRAGDVVVDVSDAADEELAVEGYELEVGDVVTIRANTTSGVFYGSRTLLQMLALSGDRSVPRGVVRDWPTASQGVRMIHSDVARKYWTPGYLKDSMRRMSWWKLNSFYFHLNEDPAFRLHDPVRYNGLAIPSGSYTKADIVGFLALAEEHHINIIPGFDVPSHATPLSVFFNIAIHDDCTPSNRPSGFTIDLTSPAAVGKIGELVKHFSGWFPGPYLSIGADEVPRQVGRCRQGRNYLRRTGGISTLGDLLIRFMNDMNDVVRGHGSLKRTIAYSNYEKLSSPDQDLDDNVIVLPWQSRNYDFNADGNETINIRWRSDGLYLVLSEPAWTLPSQRCHYERLGCPDSGFPANLAGELGAGIAVWVDGSWWATDRFVERYLHRPRAAFADGTWNDTAPGDTLAAFHARMDAVGDPPGYVGVAPRVRTDDGEPSHHWTFDDGPWPDHHHSDVGAEPVPDAVGGLHSSTVWSGAPASFDRSDRVAGDSMDFGDGVSKGLALRRCGHTGAVDLGGVGETHHQQQPRRPPALA